jgi:hypothetical protein
MRGQDGYNFGMGAGASVRKGKGKKKVAAKKAASKANYKSGGMYSTGRAITVAPGTKKNSRVTTPKPSKPSGVNRKTKVTSATPSKSRQSGRYGS